MELSSLSVQVNFPRNFDLRTTPHLLSGLPPYLLVRCLHPHLQRVESDDPSRKTDHGIFLNFSSLGQQDSLVMDNLFNIILLHPEGKLPENNGEFYQKILRKSEKNSEK